MLRSAILAIVLALLVLSSEVVADELQDKMEKQRRDYYSRWVGVRALELGPAARDRIKGPPVRLESFRGKRVLLYSFDSGNFAWGPTEEEIRRNLQALDKVRKEVGSDELAVVGFTMGPEFVFPDGELGRPSKEVRDLTDFPIVNVGSIVMRKFNEPYNLLLEPSGIVIDCNGVIIAVYLEPMTEQEIREAATQNDWKDEVRRVPVEDPWQGKGPPPYLTSSRELWSVPIRDIIGMTCGDWDLDGSFDLLAATKDKAMLVINPQDGTVKEQFPLPGLSGRLPVALNWAEIEKGKTAVFSFAGGWPDEVVVAGSGGQALWRHRPSKWGAFMDAAWVDIDGDGCTELLVGLTGLAEGLYLISSRGETIWETTDLGIVSTVSGISARGDRPGLALCTTRKIESIHVYDAAGKGVERIDAHDRYIEAFVASEMSSDGVRQVLGVSPTSAGTLDYAVATDLEGKVLWKYPVDADVMRLVPAPIISADITGDGTREWIIHPRRGELVVLDVAGRLVARFDDPARGKMLSWTAVPRESKTGLVVAASPSKLTAYTIAPLQ